MRIESKFKLGGLVVLAVMLLTTIVPFQLASWAHSSQGALRASQQKVTLLAGLLTEMQDAETGQRGFIITGKEEFLAPYYTALAAFAVTRIELQQLPDGAADWRPAIDNLYRIADLKLTELAETIAMRREKGFMAVQPVIASARGKQYMDELRAKIDILVTKERRQRDALMNEFEHRTRIGAYISLGVTMFNLLLLTALLILMFRLLKGRTEAGNALRETGLRLEAGMAEVERRNMEILLMAQMSQALESTLSLQETFAIVAIYCAKLLPRSAGTLYLFRNSRDLLELSAQWGTPLQTLATVEPQQCWGLRRGQPHQTRDAGDLCCSHYHGDDAYGHLCIPLTAQGEVLGLICIEEPLDGMHDTERKSLAITVSEQVALALTNAKLRDVLKQQSIIDPLTGLFNRRYMDETLKRELSRAERKTAPLSLIVIDLDHFKRVNDTFGHDAGDKVLSSTAQKIKDGIREGDLACRFGGEEMVLILPECDRAAAFARADTIRQSIESMALQHGAAPLGKITASFGVATYPADAGNAGSLFQAADRALYLAKSTGRNRVVAAGQASAVA